MDKVLTINIKASTTWRGMDLFNENSFGGFDYVIGRLSKGGLHFSIDDPVSYRTSIYWIAKERVDAKLPARAQLGSLAQERITSYHLEGQYDSQFMNGPVDKITLDVSNNLEKSGLVWKLSIKPDTLNHDQFSRSKDITEAFLEALVDIQKYFNRK